MKTKSSYVKVAGILFLMYFHLILITAINIRRDVNETLPGMVSSQASGMIKNQAFEMNSYPDPDAGTRPEGFIDPIPEPEPESSLEDWMFDIDYLKK